MNQKEYYEALGKLSDQYMFDQTMTNAEYLLQKKHIETTYLKSIYNPQNERTNEGDGHRPIL